MQNVSFKPIQSIDQSIKSWLKWSNHDKRSINQVLISNKWLIKCKIRKKRPLTILQTVNQSINQSIKRSINQLIDQSCSQTINQPIHISFALNLWKIIPLIRFWTIDFCVLLCHPFEKGGTYCYSTNYSSTLFVQLSSRRWLDIHL